MRLAKQLQTLAMALLLAALPADGLAADGDVGRYVVAGLGGLREADGLDKACLETVGEDGIAVVVPFRADYGARVAGKDLVAGREEHLPFAVADELGAVLHDGHDVGADAVDEAAVGKGFRRGFVELDAAVGSLAQGEMADVPRGDGNLGERLGCLHGNGHRRQDNGESD